MKITWKDGVTTVATAAAVLLERAHFHNWDWPLISNIRWALAGLLGLAAVSLLFGYVLDAFHGLAWTLIAGAIGLGIAVAGGLGLYYVDSDYAVIVMLGTVLFWMASVVRHMTVQWPMTHSHA